MHTTRVPKLLPPDLKAGLQDVLIGELIRTCSSQATLGYYMGISSRRGRPGKPVLIQSNVFLSGRTQSDRLKTVVMKTLGKLYPTTSWDVVDMKQIHAYASMTGL